MGGATGEKQAAETALATATVEDTESADIAASGEHRRIEEPRARGVAAFAGFLNPGRSETGPLGDEVAAVGHEFRVTERDMQVEGLVREPCFIGVNLRLSAAMIVLR